MDYNKELEKLIELAKKNGYELNNGLFEKTKEELVPVMEIFLFDNTTYEASGKYQIFKKTYIIDQDDYTDLFENAKLLKDKKITDDSDDDALENYYEIINIIDKYDESDIFNYKESNDGNIKILIEKYKYNNKKIETIDILYDKDDINCDFPTGYISVYMMRRDDFQNAETIDIKTKKFLRWN